MSGRPSSALKLTLGISMAVLVAVAGVLAWRSSKPQGARSSGGDGATAARGAKLPEANRSAAVASSAGVDASPVTSPEVELPGWLKQLGQLERLSSDNHARGPELERIAAAMADADVPAALETLWQNGMTEARQELAQLLLSRWANQDPENASAWLLKKPLSEAWRDSARQVASTWARSDASAAADWVRQWPDEEKNSGLLAIAYELADSAPKESLGLASELLPNKDRDLLVNHAVLQWSGSDSGTARTWADQLPPSDLRDQVYASLATALGETDPISAGAIALEKLPAGPLQDSAVVSVLQRWTQQDPGAAGDWVSEFPEGRLREAAVDNLIQIWSATEPDQAGAWANSLDAPELRDSALVSLAAVLAPSDPDRATEWVRQISDSGRRQAEMERIAQLREDARKKLAEEGAASITNSSSDTE